MNAGEISNIPSKPHSGFVGILVKHRELLEPGNRLQGNALIHQLALARALAEILESINPSESTVNLTLDMAEVAEMVRPLTEKVAEVIGKIEKLGAELNQVKEEYNRTRSSMIDRILLLEARIETMESQMNAGKSSNHDLIEMLSDNGPKGLIEAIGAEVASRSESVDSLVIGLSDQGKSPSEILKSVNEVFPPIVPSGRVGGRRRIE